MSKLNKFVNVLGFILIVLPFILFAQVSINTNDTLPDPSAMLDVKSTTKGTLLTRMNMDELSTISNPANGLQVFCTTDSKMYIFDAADNLWKELAYGAGTIIPPSPCTYTMITDSRDGKSYNTVPIGSQCWLKENLNIGTRINGSEEQTNNSVIEKYCYNDIESNCAVYGGLYQWNEMMKYVTTAGVQGICPSGWHIPTAAEWGTAMTFLGGYFDAGGKMKSTGTIEAGTGLWYSPNYSATNESGFTALPGSMRSINGIFDYIGKRGYWWSSFEYNTKLAGIRYMGYNFPYAGDDLFDKSLGISVRCVQDF